MKETNADNISNLSLFSVITSAERTGDDLNGCFNKFPKWSKHRMLLNLPSDKLTGKNPSSSIAKPLLALDHFVYPILSFEVLLRTRSTQKGNTDQVK